MKIYEKVAHLINSAHGQYRYQALVSCGLLTVANTDPEDIAVLASNSDSDAFSDEYFDVVDKVFREFRLRNADGDIVTLQESDGDIFLCVESAASMALTQQIEALSEQDGDLGDLLREVFRDGQDVLMDIEMMGRLLKSDCPDELENDIAALVATFPPAKHFKPGWIDELFGVSAQPATDGALRYEITLRSRTTYGVDTSIITVWPGQAVDDVAAKTADGYGANVEGIKLLDAETVQTQELDDNVTPANPATDTFTGTRPGVMAFGHNLPGATYEGYCATFKQGVKVNQHRSGLRRTDEATARFDAIAIQRDMETTAEFNAQSSPTP